jgi:hypothetical protein
VFCFNLPWSTSVMQTPIVFVFLHAGSCFDVLEMN